MQDRNALLEKAIQYQYPEEIPVLIGALPATVKKYGDDLIKIFSRYPDFFDEYWLNYDYEKNLPISYQYGNFTDAWGCVWSNEIEGMESYVTGHPVPNREDILTLEAPAVDTGFPHGFMYLRLLDLRGFEEAMFDFAEDAPELQILIDKVTEYNVRQMEIACKNSTQRIIFVGDDLGMQKGLAIGAEKWRKYMKPAYKKIYDVCHRYDKLVYMHTDGDLTSIFKDIQETGVDMVNPQFRANGIDNLVRLCKGTFPICLDLDRQLFPFATPDELRAHVNLAVEKMYLPEGGLALNVEFGPDVPLENIEAVTDEVYKARFYKG